MDGTFVGRAAAQAALDALLDRTRQGRSQPLAVVGAPGVGKTTMLDRLVERAGRSGFRCVVARADRTDGGVPFAALRLALDDALLAERDPSLVAVAGTLHGWLQRPSTPGSRRPPRRDQVLDALRAVVDGWAFHAPVLVALDDLHVADTDTAAALTFLLRHLRLHRVLVTVTTRDDPYLGADLAADLDRFERGGTLDVVRLGPLDRAELAELVGARLGATASVALPTAPPPPSSAPSPRSPSPSSAPSSPSRSPSPSPSPELVRMLGERSGGVPFFAVELLDALADAGALVERDGLLTVASTEPVLPRRLSTAVLHRVFQLGADARALATAASALGRVPLGDLRLVAELARLDAGRAEAAFDALVRAEVLVAGDGGYRFAHAIVGDAVYGDLGPAARRRLHGEIAVALVEGSTVERSADVVEVAGHVRRAGGGPDPAAADLLGRAGDALRLVAPAAAAAWYREALVRRGPEAPAAPALALQLRLSRALHLAHEHQEASVVARAVLASAAGPDRERAREAAARSLLACGRVEEAAALLDEGPEGGGTRSEQSSPWLLRAQVHLVAGRPAEAARCLAAARSERRCRASSPSDRATDLAVELHLRCATGDHTAAAALAGALQAELEEGSGTCRLTSRLALCGASAFDLDPAVAIAEAEALGEGAPLRAWFDAAAAWASYRRGQWDDARRRAEAAEAAIDGAAGSLASGAILAVRIAVPAERGDVAAAERAVREAAALPIPVFRSGVETASALLLRARGRHGEAAAVLRSAEQRERAEGRRNGLAMVLAQQVEAALERGDPSSAHDADEELQSFASSAEAVALTMRQLLARAAVRAEQDAAAAARELGALHGLAVDGAQALGLLGTIRADADVLVEAYLELGRLGASVRQRSVARALRRLGRRVPTDPRRVDGLRPVEVDIVGLVAAGLSNRQIGQRTGLSPKTIEVYLSRIYAKTGHRSRVELAVASRDGQLGRG